MSDKLQVGDAFRQLLDSLGITASTKQVGVIAAIVVVAAFMFMTSSSKISAEEEQFHDQMRAWFEKYHDSLRVPINSLDSAPDPREAYNALVDITGCGTTRMACEGYPSTIDYGDEETDPPEPYSKGMVTSLGRHLLLAEWANWVNEELTEELQKGGFIASETDANWKGHTAAFLAEQVQRNDLISRSGRKPSYVQVDTIVLLEGVNDQADDIVRSWEYFLCPDLPVREALGYSAQDCGRWW